MDTQTQYADNQTQYTLSARAIISLMHNENNGMKTAILGTIFMYHGKPYLDGVRQIASPCTSFLVQKTYDIIKDLMIGDADLFCIYRHQVACDILVEQVDDNMSRAVMVLGLSVDKFITDDILFGKMRALVEADIVFTPLSSFKVC